MPRFPLPAKRSGPLEAEPVPPLVIGPTDELGHRLLHSAGARTGSREIVLLGSTAHASRLFFPALLALEKRNALIVRAIIDPESDGDSVARGAFPRALHASSLAAVPSLPAALAIIASAPSQHLAQTSAALKRGWHVLCSSPFALQAADAALMIASAERHERLLAVDLRARFFPTLVYLRTLCRDNLLGPALSFEIHLGEAQQLRPIVPGRERPEPPDGVLADLGGPSLELLTWCFGPATVVKYSDDAMGGVEANACIELSFREGLRGTIHLSRDWPIADAHTFVFERGIVRWAGKPVNTLTLQLASAPFALAAELVSPLAAGHSLPAAPWVATEEEAGVAQLENVIAAIAGREVLRTPAAEALHSLSLINTCYAHRTPLPQPWLSRNDALHARALSPPAALRRP